MSPRDLHEAAPSLAALDALLMVHAEWPAALEHAAGTSGDRRSYATWLAGRPVTAETDAVRFLIGLAREWGLRVHVVHVSASETLELIAAARARRRPDDGGDLPALPRLRRRRDSRRRHGVQVRPADPRGAAPRRPVGGAGAWPARRGRERPFPGAAGDEAAGGGRLSPSLGRHRVAPAPASRDLDRRAGKGIPSRAAGRVALRGPRPSGRAHRPQGRHRRGPRRRSGPLASGEGVRGERHGLRHRHPITPWLGRTLAGVVEATYLRGEQAYASGAADQPARGRLLTRLDS